MSKLQLIGRCTGAARDWCNSTVPSAVCACFRLSVPFFFGTPFRNIFEVCKNSLSTLPSSLAFHGVALPRFPGGLAGLYLKPMLVVLYKCAHTGPRGPILTLVKYGSPYQSHTTKCICVDLRFFFISVMKSAFLFSRRQSVFYSQNTEMNIS